MATQDLTSPVAAMYLAAGAFFWLKWPPMDLTSSVAAMYLAAGAWQAHIPPLGPRIDGLSFKLDPEHARAVSERFGAVPR